MGKKKTERMEDRADKKNGRAISLYGADGVSSYESNAMPSAMMVVWKG